MVSNRQSSKPQQGHANLGRAKASGQVDARDDWLARRQGNVEARSEWLTVRPRRSATRPRTAALARYRRQRIARCRQMGHAASTRSRSLTGPAAKRRRTRRRLPIARPDRRPRVFMAPAPRVDGAAGMEASGVSGRRFIVGLVALIVLVAAIAGGYVLGESDAPSETEAQRAATAAQADSARRSETEAIQRGKERGDRAGLAAGQRSGRRSGTRRGGAEGVTAVENEQAKEQQAEADRAAAAQTPEDKCRGSLNEPQAYGECLEGAGQDPGAPLNDYCAAHPEVTEAGFCPSLNE